MTRVLEYFTTSVFSNTFCVHIFWTLYAHTTNKTQTAHSPTIVWNSNTQELFNYSSGLLWGGWIRLICLLSWRDFVPKKVKDLLFRPERVSVNAITASLNILLYADINSWYIIICHMCTHGINYPITGKRPSKHTLFSCVSAAGYINKHGIFISRRECTQWCAGSSNDDRSEATSLCIPLHWLLYTIPTARAA